MRRKYLDQSDVVGTERFYVPAVFVIPAMACFDAVYGIMPCGAI